MGKIARTLGALVVSALFLSACGSGEVLGPPDSNPDDPLIQIHSEGGFVPVEWSLGNGPTFTVTYGGEFIFQGFTTLEYPGRLLPPYLEADLDDEQMTTIRDLLNDMGIAEIDQEHDGSVDNVADASTEVITYWDQEGVHRYSVYALGISDHPASDTTAAFAELFDYLHQLSASVDGAEYEPDRVRVVAGTYQGGFDSDFVRVEDWPLEGENPDDWDVYTSIGEDEWTCKAFDPSILDAFADAKQTTIYTHPDGSGEQVQLLVRPLHPGEAECSN